MQEHAHYEFSLSTNGAHMYGVHMMVSSLECDYWMICFSLSGYLLVITSTSYTEYSTYVGKLHTYVHTLPTLPTYIDPGIPLTTAIQLNRHSPSQSSLGDIEHKTWIDIRIETEEKQKDKSYSYIYPCPSCRKDCSVMNPTTSSTVCTTYNVVKPGPEKAHMTMIRPYTYIHEFVLLPPYHESPAHHPVYI